MFARRLVALALTSIILLGIFTVPSFLLTISSLLSSQPSRELSSADVLGSCSALDSRSDLSLALDLAGMLTTLAGLPLSLSSTPTNIQPATQTQPTSFVRLGLMLAAMQRWLVGLSVQAREHAASTMQVAWQQLAAQYQYTHARPSVLRL